MTLSGGKILHGRGVHSGEEKRPGSRTRFGARPAAGLSRMGGALLLVLLLAMSSQAAHAAPSDVRVGILLDPHKTCRAVAAVAEKALREHGYQVESVELPQRIDGLTEGTEQDSQPAAAKTTQASDAYLASVKKAVDHLRQTKPTLVISLGEEGTALALKDTQQIPVVFSMVPNVLDSPFVVNGKMKSGRLAGVAIDVSPKQQLEWIGRVQPNSPKIGILYSERSKHTVAAIAEESSKTSITIAPILASREAFPKAIDDLNAARCDGILMIADAQVYNLACLRRVLLWGVRQRKTVWAFSDSLVKAGACAAIYVDYEAVGSQTAAVAQKIISGAKPASIGLQYPDKLQTAINVRTAELVGLSIPRNVLDSVSVKFGTEK